MIEIDDALFRDCLTKVAHTEEGKVVLANLKLVLGWDDIMMSIESPEANIYYQTRRAVYGWMRGIIPEDDLKRIEFNYKRKVVKNDGRSSITARRLTGSRASTGAGSK